MYAIRLALVTGISFPPGFSSTTCKDNKASSSWKTLILCNWKNWTAKHSGKLFKYLKFAGIYSRIFTWEVITSYEGSYFLFIYKSTLCGIQLSDLGLQLQSSRPPAALMVPRVLSKHSAHTGQPPPIWNRKTAPLAGLFHLTFGDSEFCRAMLWHKQCLLN